MTTSVTSRLLDHLAELKNRFAPREAERILTVLRRLARQRIDDAESLIRFHETLLFLRAYPQTAPIVQETELQLRDFPKRIRSLREAGVDLSALEHPEVSGIAGTSVTDTFTYDIVCWLLKRHPTQLAIHWDWFEDESRLAEAWPRFMPLLEEDAFVEANVPYREWLQAARNGRADMAWLCECFSRLPLTDKERAELYNSQKLYVRWTPAYRATRTGMRRPKPKLFYHRGALIQRREVYLREELEKAPPSLQKLSRSRGEAALDMSREASTIRYRELYGFTHGDPEPVWKTDLGRGVELFLVGLPAERRLPLRAYHGAMIFKNGVPIGYFEGLSLFERMESGFNLYYTFREGETAWLYARTLNVMRHVLGVTAFSLDPYQIGHENEEGIESGAFWFYRKLGFCPTRRALLKLTEKEEEKIRTRENYRTSAATLRRLAAGPMILELSPIRPGDWDQFQVRNMGLAVQRQMAARFEGDARKMREEATRRLERLLDLSTAAWTKTERTILSDFSVVLLPISEQLREWSSEEKRRLREVIKAKAGRDEARYLKLMQSHARLRSALIDLGS